LDKSGQKLSLSRKQMKVIPVIIAAKSVTEGVKQAGISKTLFYNWLKQESFKNEFISRQNDIIDAAFLEIKGLASLAVAKLGSLLESEKDTVRLKATTAVLEHISKMIEAEELTKRIEKLERRLNGL
jgi:hypothetical protein